MAGLVLVIVTLPTVAFGDPVKWELEEVVFDGGGTASGSFMIDVDTGVFSDVLITTTAGAYPGATYSGEVFSTIFAGNSLQFVRFASASGDLTDAFTFSMYFLQPLANGGGVSNLLESESAEVDCASADCGIDDGVRFIVTGGRVRSVASTVSVAIDVKPGAFPNCFNVNGHGVVPVAVLGSEVLDVALVDQYSLLFGGLAVRVRGNKGPLCNFEDSNGDGYEDLVCKFEDDPSYWEPGDGTATLTGTLLDGTKFEGTDTICIVP
jgi:hypothetical protein